MLKNSRNKGITLIALVITIIVLLILAGISISMLAGDNSILKKAVEAKDLTEVSQEKENISLAYNSVIINKTQKESKSITLDDFDKAIKSYDNNATTSSEGSKIIVTFSNGHKYTVYKNGTVSEYTEPPYAKDILTVTVSEDSIESPYYVNYPSAKGTIKCRVLYNDDTYGLQIVSVQPITNVLLGKEDPNENVVGEMGTLERAQNSYNRAITTLNEKAEEYIETTNGNILATDARCIGSEPLNKNYPENISETNARMSEMAHLDDAFMTNYNNKCFKSDNHYTADVTRLTAIGAYDYNKQYWIASHRVSKISTGNVVFYIRIYFPTLGLNSYSLWKVDTSGNASCNNASFGFRPVFMLSPNLKIIDGDGTEEVPFEIGL